MNGQKFTERQIETLKRHAAERAEMQCRQHNALIELGEVHDKQFSDASRADNVIPIKPN